MKISRVSENQYEIRDGEERVVFSREKFEDLYYAVPLNQTSFLRLLLDNVCQSTEERHLINGMLDRASERSVVLDDLQKQIQNMDYEGE